MPGRWPTAHLKPTPRRRNASPIRRGGLPRCEPTDRSATRRSPARNELLLRAARFEVGRRRAALSHVRGEELDDVAMQAADDALMAVLSKLDHFRGEPVYDVGLQVRPARGGVRLRRRAWQEREVVLEPDSWTQLADRRDSVHAELEGTELLEHLKAAIDSRLTSHQRRVFVALAVNEVPIDVLSERLAAARGALYKTLHDARRKPRAELANGLVEPNSDEDRGRSR